jgi:amidase
VFCGPDHNDLTAYSSAQTMACALRRRQISAVELLDFHLARVERFDPSLNSIIVRDYERARKDAQLADERLAAGDHAPLLGVPVTIKESIDVLGLPSTAGVTQRVGHRAERDAPTVARLRAAGAVIFGKTNVCTWLADYQVDNPVYGRTLSPWDPKRTPGGSSGGSASLAAGLTPLDLGSDLGGSIRVPAAFSGLWGHKPSDGLVPNTGHFPGSAFPNPALPLAVQGPHARSAADVELALNVIAGPISGNEVAWQLLLPAARHHSLASFRVAVLPKQDWLEVDSQILAAQEKVVAFLRRVGAHVVEIEPPMLGDLRDYYRLFRSMMSVTISTRWNADHRHAVVADKMARQEEFHAADARGILATAADLTGWLTRREEYRAAWREFFTDWDVLLAPITLTPAFEHTSVPNADRRLNINGKSVEFEYMSFYPSLGTLTGQPVTAFPADLSTEGLPLGLQVIGPFLEDRTTLQFASLLECEFRPFVAPPGYELFSPRHLARE